MSMKKLGTIVAIGAAACGLALGGAALASAASSPTTSTSTSSTAEDNRGGSADTAVTGAEAEKVIAAVKAKDSTASITSVRKDPDGSYDALGTKDGANVMFDVSADLKTITQNAGGHGGGGHGGGGSADTAVTGAEAEKVIAAVKAKDSTASITSVRKDPDGSYDALGTKDGANVMFDVSADLKTITQNADGHGGGGHRDDAPDATSSATTAPSATT